jgi:cyclin B
MSSETFDREQMLSAERELLVVVGFDLGAPLSYRFLRRFARVSFPTNYLLLIYLHQHQNSFLFKVSKTDMITLTLARYILELSLMSLRFCRQSDSLIAAACLILARQMRHLKDVWVSFIP